MRLIDGDAFVQQVCAMTVVNGYSSSKTVAMCSLIKSQLRI